MFFVEICLEYRAGAGVGSVRFVRESVGVQLKSPLPGASGRTPAKKFPPQTMQKQVHGLFPQYPGIQSSPTREGTFRPLDWGSKGVCYWARLFL